MTPHPDPLASMPRLALSVCMIVRDEGERLAAALASVQGIAREIVVVDTGSTDATVAIARAHGATVLHFAWVDDFAAARNVALAAASGDWILSLDADQRLPADAVPALARAVARRDCLAQVVTIAMRHDEAEAAEVSTYSALRLFRRDPRIRYRGRVHEDVADALLAIGSDPWPDSGVRLLDVGYVDPGERQRKRLRNAALLRASHREAPESLYVAYKLAITLSAATEGAERRALLAQALERAVRLDAREAGALPFLPRLVALATNDLVAQGRLVEAVAALRALQPAMAGALVFTFGVALARAGLFDEAGECLRAFIAQGEADRKAGQARDAIVLHDEAAHPAEAARWLAWVARAQGAHDVAADWLRRAAVGASPDQLVDIGGEAVDLRLAQDDAAGAAQAIDELAALVQRHAAGLPRLMRASAQLARATGDVATAFELAQAAAAGIDDDDAAVLLATLEIEAGPLAPERLRHHHDAIAGRRFDTLAVKRLIGDSLGLPWPSALPEATRAVLRDLQGG